MSRGYLGLLLHAHLPYVRHPEHDLFLEENWLFEAITECYLPLLRALERLQQTGEPSLRLTLSLSPTLITMLQDELLQQRYLDHMQRLTALARRETQRKHPDNRTQAMADRYLRLFEQSATTYLNHYQCDLVTPFKRLQQNNRLEVITTAATHGFLPLLRTQPGAIRAQLATAAEFHRELFEQPSPGVWLPECGYYPGLEEALEKQGFRYFIVDTHGLLQASHKPWHGTAAPLACPNGVAVFGRDLDSSQQVWSTEQGYPGDSWYREFHRDIGFERPLQELEPFLPAGAERSHTGIKYFRVTNQGQYKQPYEPARARQRIEVHAEDFLERQRQAVRHLSKRMERPPMLVAPYDAELFGHWWYEGAEWMQQLLTRVNRQEEIEMITPLDYLKRHPTLQCAQPSASSWGELGYNAYWLNEHNDWIYPHLHSAATNMHRLAVEHIGEKPGTPLYRALQQAGRSLLLAQASDWPFILKSGTTTAYAEQRLRDLLSRFHFLQQSIKHRQIDLQRLQALEQMDCIFPQLDFHHFIDQE